MWNSLRSRVLFLKMTSQQWLKEPKNSSKESTQESTLKIRSNKLILEENLAMRIQLFTLAPRVARLKSLRKMEVAFSKISRIIMQTRLGLKLNI